MTKDKALKMAIDELMKALKLLQRFEPQIVGDNITAWTVGLRNQLSDLQHTLYNNGLVETIKACKEALEQPAPAPVAWMHRHAGEITEFNDFQSCQYCEPLYTHPHQWQGLTDFELKDIRTLCDYSQYESAGEWAYRVQLATEQALKEKNT